MDMGGRKTKQENHFQENPPANQNKNPAFKQALGHGHEPTSQLLEDILL